MMRMYKIHFKVSNSTATLRLRYLVSAVKNNQSAIPWFIRVTAKLTLQ